MKCLKTAGLVQYITSNPDLIRKLRRKFKRLQFKRFKRSKTEINKLMRLLTIILIDFSGKETMQRVLEDILYIRSNYPGLPIIIFDPNHSNSWMLSNYDSIPDRLCRTVKDLVEQLRDICSLETSNQNLSEINYFISSFSKIQNMREYKELISTNRDILNYRFRKTFKEITGKTLIEFRNEILINMARGYLIYSNINVNQITIRLGFCNPSYFIKIFKKQTGETPWQFRKQLVREFSKQRDEMLEKIKAGEDLLGESFCYR